MESDGESKQNYGYASSDDEPKFPPPPPEEELEQVKGWNLFEVNDPGDTGDTFVDGTCYQVILQTLKILIYMMTFVVVLGGAITAKSSLLLMTSQLQPGRQMQNCNNSLPQFDGKELYPLPQEEKVYWTWAILFAFWIPEILTFLRSLRICLFKGQKRPTWLQFLVLFITETFHTIGVGLFVFIVLPNLDVIKGAVLMSTVCILPSILGLLSRREGKFLMIFRIIDGIAIFFQLSALGLWILFPEEETFENIWILPISILLISFGWWSNYVETFPALSFMSKLDKFKQNMLKTGYFSYLFISMWKIVLFFGVMVGCYEISWKNSADIFEMAKSAFSFYTRQNYTFDPQKVGLLNGTGIWNGVPNGLDIGQNPLLYQVLSAYLCYIIGKYACKICIQQFSFALPLTMAVPVTVSVLILFCENDVCFLQSPFFGHLRYSCPTGDYFTDQHAWMWLLWFMSQTWITIHIWFPPYGERLAKTENLFTSPMYNGLLVDQSLALNRRRNNEDKKMARALALGRQKFQDNNNVKYRSTDQQMDSVPKIYACATMWHENKEEMIEILKSIFRMDEDQCSRRIALEHFDVMDMEEIGYYEYETHIFFDDAFRLSDHNDYNSPMVLNDYVKLLIECADEAAMRIHNGYVSLRPPQKYPTPYGGRLEWTLPGKTKMIAHLKDKSKIRHRKRWSQVMYMYYFLGNRLMDLDIHPDRKEIISQNTYLLALDGDVDFKPKAVELLVDLMRKNPKLGAACGRIHPTGGGPMVWYQKFEYATGHWFQKATEHMLGCVLCSPGCFSLFRGAALMSENVMAKYTTISDEPLHYVQYDQGEDRWLCTLLLQQGFRVDYSAASDAYTHAPEDFNEFYNQRRRWVPSTTANILDLLLDYKRTVKINPDISIFYIIYQFMLMFGAIMGPGTIFLMLVGAFTAVFGLSSWLSFFLNAIPILLFSLVCFFAKSATQLKVAQILSVLYALIMVAVVVGIAVNATQEGILAPSSIFLIAVASSFIITALLHPLEFDCLFHGLLYFITIPSMYLLLIIFSVFNLNNVSWGTREGPKLKSKQELQAEEKAQEEMKKKQQKGGFFATFLGNGKDDTEGSFECSFAGLFTLMCCTHKKEDKDVKLAASLEVISGKLDALEKKLANATGEHPSSISSRRTQFIGQHRDLETLAEDEDLETTVPMPSSARPPEDPNNPTWIKDKCLMRRAVDSISADETIFWKELIAKYLYPIDADPAKEKKLTDELMQLRNQCVFYFFLMNSIFVLLIFLLELEKDIISIDWPFGDKDLKLEPIATVFLVFFAVILLIQFIAMLLHRVGTLSHILASLDLFITKLCSNLSSKKTKTKNVAKNQVGLIKQLQKMKEIESAEKVPEIKTDEDDEGITVVKRLHRRTMEPKSDESLEDRFTKNFGALSTFDNYRKSQVVGRVFPHNTEKSMKALNRLTMHQNRNSVAFRTNPLPGNISIRMQTASRIGHPEDSNV